MRMNSTQVGYKPSVWLLDTDTGSVIEIPLGIKQGVFDTSRIEEEAANKEKTAEISAKLEAFTSQMQGSDEKPDFEKTLKLVMAESNKRVQGIIRELIT